MIQLVSLLLTLSMSNQTFGQSATIDTRIDVSIHSRVDTSNKEIKEIAALWINYLNSKPDSLYNNPYWNQAEKSTFKDFDFSRAYLYPFSSNQLLRYFNPTILSIEKEGDYYGIRTIFSADGLDGDYRKSNPWCITKLYAIKEGDEWKLKNALPILTENWNRHKVGKITFIYPEHHPFNKKLARKASLFCNQISKAFQFPEWEPFDFYITENGDDLGKLLNFDFFFAGYTTGIAMNDNRMLLGGNGSEYYPHEFVHLIVPKFDRHQLIEEGFATWKGGQAGKTFEESAKILANELSKNDSITFSDILNRKWGWEFAAFYTSGAILCNAVYEKGGVKIISLFLNIKNNDKALISFILELFELKPEELDVFWRTEVLKYNNRQ